MKFPAKNLVLAGCMALLGAVTASGSVKTESAGADVGPVMPWSCPCVCFILEKTQTSQYGDTMLDATNTSCRDGGGADLTAFLGSGPFFSDVAAAPSAPRLDCELGTHDLSFPEPEVASGPFVPDYPARGGDCDPEDDGWTEISNHDATKSARHFDIRSLTYQQANGAHPCNNYHFECGEEESDVNELLLDAIDSPTPEAVSSLLRKLKKERVFVNDERDAVQVLNCSGNVVAQFPREMAAGLSFATK